MRTWKSANAYWMHDPGKDWAREKFYQGYSEERLLPENFEQLEHFFRVETLVQLVASLIMMEEFSQEEIEFYSNELKSEINSQ